ncbi:MAG: serine--tRNA ligase [Methanomassiliicoccales archaeon]|nr:MAG: serine--tRNA ligase [Methanomassiliicoccales archaeon]
MLDIRLFRESPDTIKANLKKRGWTEEEIGIVDTVVESDLNWRKSRQEVDALKHKRNVVTEEISELKKAGKDISDKIKAMGTLNEEIKKLDESTKSFLEKRDELLLRIPNLMHESVPMGKDESENVPLRYWGEQSEYEFELKSHQDIIEGLNQGDFELSGKTSGAGFYFLYEDLVMLDLALSRFAIDNLRSSGFKLIEPPFMLRKKAMQGVVDLADFENMLYKIENEDLYLIATSEHSMCAMLMDKVLREKDLPIRLCGVSPCFRKEVGAHGIDTKGIFRTHQFNKVEQFVFSTPDHSWDEHELLIKNAETLFQKLEIPYRIVNICTGDLGGTAAKKYDLDAWMPRQKEFREVVSCSNCTDYQARKLNIRYDKPDGQREYVHTINSTAIANSRAIVAILENYQQDDGTVMVPKVLRPYMDGLEVIGKR